MFGNKELKDDIDEIKQFLVKAGIAQSPSLVQTSAGFDLLRLRVEELGGIRQRLGTLEYKFKALCELLGVQVVEPEKDLKLKKGNKEVTIAAITYHAQ